MQQQNAGSGKLLRNRSRAELGVNGIFDFPFSIRPATGFLESGFAIHREGSHSHEPLRLAGLLKIIVKLGLKIGGCKEPSGRKHADHDPSIHLLHGCNHKACPSDSGLHKSKADDGNQTQRNVWAKRLARYATGMTMKNAPMSLMTNCARLSWRSTSG